MDFSSALGECDALIIQVDSENALLERIETLRKYYPLNATHIQKLASKSANHDVTSQVFTESAPISHKIELELI